MRDQFMAAPYRAARMNLCGRLNISTRVFMADALKYTLFLMVADETAAAVGVAEVQLPMVVRLVGSLKKKERVTGECRK